MDGIEQTFAVNHLAGFHLANRLTPLLEANAPSRIVVVASQIHAGNFKGDFETKEPDYNGYTVYEESKLANVLFTYELARKLEGKQVTVNCLHPGVIQTKLLENLSKSKSSSGNGSSGGLSLKKIARALKWRTKKILGITSGDTVESAAALIGQLVNDPDLESVSGKYFHSGKMAESKMATYSESLAKKLWNESEKIVADRLSGS